MDLNIKILVVDDFPAIRLLIKGTLKQLGFNNIIEAEDGIMALRILEEKNFGLILADWNMPNMSGLDLLKAVRNDENLKNIPFIMVTAEGQQESVVKAAKAGISNYIMKPFSPDILIEKIEKVLN